jgi:hypothetical protein
VLSLRLDQPLPRILAEDWCARFTLEALPGNHYRLGNTRMEDAPALLGRLREAGAAVEAWSWGRQHLDDVFMALTHRTLRDD